MSKTAILYDPVFLRHDTGQHPENSKRLEAITAILETSPFASRLEWVGPLPASRETIEAVHDKDYVSFVHDQCTKGANSLDADTIICLDSWDAAITAAGAVTKAVDGVISGEYHNAFCAVRPPGHHAESAKAMGFCLFNNIAIGAMHARQVHGVGRVAIVDFDVHHGNGTQNSFYEDPNVFFVSLHQAYHYPGTGLQAEVGEGRGKGMNLNFPMESGAGDKEYLEIFSGQIIPTLRRYAPEMILISAGFDGHADDPLAGLDLTEKGYAEMTSALCELSDELGNAGIVSTLEGGYNLSAIASSALVHVEELTKSR